MSNLGRKLPSCLTVSLSYQSPDDCLLIRFQASKHERAKKSPTFKDLDFMDILPEGLLLEPETYNALISTLRRDCRVLESFRIMDYSLLVGVHNLDQSAREDSVNKTCCSSRKVPSFSLLPLRTRKTTRRVVRALRKGRRRRIGYRRQRPRRSWLRPAWSRSRHRRSPSTNKNTCREKEKV